METTYSELVSRVLKNGVLAKAAKDISKETYNFVTSNWQTQLESNAFFHDCQLPFGQREIESEKYTFEALNPKLALSVTLVGECRFSQPYESSPAPSITIKNCSLLTKIAENMTSDLGSHIQISDEFKFTFNECSRLGCCHCREISKMFAQKGYVLSKLHQPCICITKVFDGEKIYNRFYSQMEEMFPRDFIAIMQLKIFKRYKYLHDKTNQIMHRIGGIVTNLIAFNEAKLEMSPQMIFLGDLSNFEVNENVLLKDKSEEEDQSSAKNDIYSGEEDEFNILEESTESVLIEKVPVGKRGKKAKTGGKKARVEESYFSINE